MVADRFRLRVAYGKQGRLRYLSHLEVLGTIDRCVRRAGLPFAVSEGFNVRMRINFSSALSQGSASSCEYYDLLLTEYVPAAEALARLKAATPPDLAPFAARYVAWELPSLEAFLTRSDWELELRPTTAPRHPGQAAHGDPAPCHPERRTEGPESKDLQPSSSVKSLAPFQLPSASVLEAAISDLAATGELSYRRGKKLKRINLNETLLGFAVREEGECRFIDLSTHTGIGASLRLDVLVKQALASCGYEADFVLLPTRTAQYGEDDHGNPIPAL